jgi:hypothetical protein
MSWPDQVPPATDVILHLNVPCAAASPARLEIDKLPDGLYRATVDTLFEHQEICRTADLEALIRQANGDGRLQIVRRRGERLPGDADARLRS